MSPPEPQVSVYKVRVMTGLLGGLDESTPENKQREESAGAEHKLNKYYHSLSWRPGEQERKPGLYSKVCPGTRSSL